jgi:hypothetical protein
MQCRHPRTGVDAVTQYFRVLWSEQINRRAVLRMSLDAATEMKQIGQNILKIAVVMLDKRTLPDVINVRNEAYSLSSSGWPHITHKNAHTLVGICQQIKMIVRYWI